MSKTNPSIGTCPCPICREPCTVKRFRHQATADGNRRKAGLLYMDCSTHGRFGFDGKPKMQEWIRENGKLDEDQSAAPASAPSTAPASAASTANAPASSAARARAAAGASAPASTAGAAKPRSPWKGFF
jgi:hypothetical protein